MIHITTTTMIAKTTFFIFPLLLILLPVFLYKKNRPYLMAIWYRLAFDKDGQKTAATLLVIVIMLFILTYHTIFPNDIGIFISLHILFALLSPKYTARILLAIRRNKYLFRIHAILIILILFIPHTLSIAYILAVILECASIFPATGLENFYEKQLEDEGLGKQFTDAYFR